MKLPYSLPLLAPKVYVLRLMIELEDDKTKYTLGIYEDQLLNFSYIVVSFTSEQ